LSDSASALKHLPDSAEILTGAAGKLQNLTDSAEVLSVAAPKLGAAADNAEMVQSAASDLSSAFTAAMDNSTAFEISQAKQEVDAASHYLSQVAAGITNAVRNASE